MDNPNHSNKTALIILRFIIILYLILSIFGRNFFENNWSFLHVYHLPLWYDILLIAGVGLVFFLPQKWEKLFIALANSYRLFVLSAIIIIALLFLFQFNSFVHGAGNLRVAQIGQVPVIVHRWFEFGSSVTVTFFYSLFSLISLETTKAAVYAWKTVAFISTILSLIGAWYLAGALVNERMKRILFSLLIFGGPQLIMMFAPVAVETIIPAVVIWWSLLAVLISRRFSMRNVALLWLVSLIGIGMVHTLAILIPATLFVSIPRSSNKTAWLSHFLAALSLFGLFYLAYSFAGSNMEYSRSLLFFIGKNPHASYSLFSIRHISDFIQTVWMSFPLMITAGYLWWQIRREKTNLLTPVVWLVLPGIIFLFIIDPVNGIVFDLPRMLAYLAPLAILFVILITISAEKAIINSRIVIQFTLLSLLISLSYIPVFTFISNSDSYATEYLEKHRPFHQTACFSFRDAYFYRGEMTRDFATSKADSWEQKQKVKFQGQIQLSGILELAKKGRKTDAVNELFQMTLRYPYWTEPKAVLAKLQMEYKQFDRAAKYLSECRELEPYNPDHYRLQYIYYRDIQNYSEAIATLDQLLELVPGDSEAITDKMIAYFRAGELNVADSLGDYLMLQDPSKPYPYLIRGFIQEKKNNPTGAIYYYQSLVKLNASEASEYNIPARLDSLQAINSN